MTSAKRPRDQALSNVEQERPRRALLALHGSQRHALHGRDLIEDKGRKHRQRDQFGRGRHIGQGEVDFVVVSPGGSIGLIEQKNGLVTIEGEEYIKHYGLLRKW